MRVRCQKRRIHRRRNWSMNNSVRSDRRLSRKLLTRVHVARDRTREIEAIVADQEDAAPPPHHHPREDVAFPDRQDAIIAIHCPAVAVTRESIATIVPEGEPREDHDHPPVEDQFPGVDPNHEEDPIPEDDPIHAEDPDPNRENAPPLECQDRGTDQIPEDVRDRGDVPQIPAVDRNPRETRVEGRDRVSVDVLDRHSVIRR